MSRQIQKNKRLAVFAVIMQAALLCFLYLVLSKDILFAALVLAVESVALFIAFDQFDSISRQQSVGVKNALEDVAADAYLLGGIGMACYDDDYVITWMSDLFVQKGMEKIGQKVLTWIPEADDLISGRADKVMASLDGTMFEIYRRDDTQMLMFKDVTEIERFKDLYDSEHVVLGLASFDNYEESVMYADEADMALIGATVRVPLTEYCAKHGIFYRRLNSNYRYMLVLNEKILNELVEDHFSVLNNVRRSAAQQDLALTLSMAFARGTSDFSELDTMVTKLIDLAQSRGGDQVAVQAAGSDVKYFGGSTEAAEKRSKVRVRVMAHALRDLIMKSSNVIICGHKTADFDCIGSAMCLSRLVTAMHKQVVIIAKTGGIEEKLMDAMKANETELKKEVTFVTEGEAINQLHDTTLVIMTDHHNIRQSNGAKLLESAKKIAVIDHHRRATEMGVKPVLMYIEPYASSACELITEMVPYLSGNADISDLIATFMLAGMIVDTQKWRVRTGARTYESASKLRQMGGDPQKAYDYLKDTYDEFATKSAVVSACEKYKNGVVIAAVKDRQLTRSLMSQVADSLLGVQEVKASFVIADVADGETAISARSNGRVNVQIIMERMKGGGHMTAAAMQRSKTSVEALKNELTGILDTYFKEEIPDESDS